MAIVTGRPAGIGQCPRCKGNLFPEHTYTPLSTTRYEVFCLQCGYRENKPYEGVILAKRHPAKHERGYRRRR